MLEFSCFRTDRRRSPAGPGLGGTAVCARMGAHADLLQPFMGYLAGLAVMAGLAALMILIPLSVQVIPMNLLHRRHDVILVGVARPDWRLALQRVRSSASSRNPVAVPGTSLMSIARTFRVQERIASAARRAARNPTDITLMGDKHSMESIREAYSAGLRLFGENRVQEFAGKLPALRDLTHVELAPDRPSSDQ